MDTALSTRMKFIVAVMVIALLGLVLFLDQRRRAAEEQLTQLSVKIDQLTGNSEKNKETAARVVRSVGKLFLLPEGIDPTVAAIVNVDALRSRNPFYKKAENGDYLVVTPERAILYDPDKNIILDVAPVQIRPAQPGAPAS